MTEKQELHQVFTRLSNLCYRIHVKGEYEVDYTFSNGLIHIYIKRDGMTVSNFLSGVDHLDNMNEICEELEYKYIKY